MGSTKAATPIQLSTITIATHTRTITLQAVDPEDGAGLQWLAARVWVWELVPAPLARRVQLLWRGVWPRLRLERPGLCLVGRAEGSSGDQAYQVSTISKAVTRTRGIISGVRWRWAGVALRWHSSLCTRGATARPSSTRTRSASSGERATSGLNGGAAPGQAGRSREQRAMPLDLMRWTADAARRASCDRSETLGPSEPRLWERYDGPHWSGMMGSRERQTCHLCVCLVLNSTWLTLTASGTTVKTWL